MIQTKFYQDESLCKIMTITIIRNEAFKIRTAAELQSERIRKEAAELAAKVKDQDDVGENRLG